MSQGASASLIRSEKSGSLREFQQRLAARLSQAQKGQQVASHLAVEVGNRKLLFPLAEAGEIASSLQIQPLPHSRAWFLGVTVLRGQVVGVVDLAVLVGERTQSTASGTYIAMGDALEINCLLRVDRLAGLRGMEQLKLEGGALGSLGRQFKDAQDTVWEELSLAQLARDEQFLQVCKV
jgi:twitching motility protein PilI